MSEKTIAYTVNTTEPQEKKHELPILTSDQDRELSELPTPFDRVERLIDMLGLKKLTHEPEPEYEKMVKGLALENRVNNLYNSIVEDCETACSPLFNRLSSGHLLYFLHPDYKPVV